MLIDLDESIHKQAGDFATAFTSLVNGLSPVVTSSVMVAPFILSKLGYLGVEAAFLYSMLIGGLEIFLVGVYLGKLSEGSTVYYGVRMLAAAVTPMATRVGQGAS